MKKVVLAFVLFFILAPFFQTYAAPAPWGIAINTQTEECAGYWAGDEFSSNPLPDGWDDYYPKFSGGMADIVTPIGTCTFDSEEACCEQLGYEYVSDNIGIEDNSYGYDDLDEPKNIDISVIGFLSVTFCCCFFGIFALVAMIVAITFSIKQAQMEPPSKSKME